MRKIEIIVPKCGISCLYFSQGLSVIKGKTIQERYCGAILTTRGYDRIIKTTKKPFPKWCPLKEMEE